MKRLYLVIYLCILTYSFAFAQNTSMCTELDSILNKEVKESPYKYMEMKFFTINGKRFISLCPTTDIGEESPDGHIIYNNKIVVCYFSNMCEYYYSDLIKGVIPADSILSNTDYPTQMQDGNCKLYYVKDSNTITNISHKRFSFNHRIKNDKLTVIHNRFRRILDDYMNEHPNFMYEIRFEKIKGNIYLTIRPTEKYYNDNYSAYYICSDVLVCLYGLDRIDKNWLFSESHLNHSEPSSCYKKGIRDSSYGPGSKRYIIKSRSIEECPPIITDIVNTMELVE